MVPDELVVETRSSRRRASRPGHSAGPTGPLEQFSEGPTLVVHEATRLLGLCHDTVGRPRLSAPESLKTSKPMPGGLGSRRTSPSRRAAPETGTLPRRRRAWRRRRRRCSSVGRFQAQGDVGADQRAGGGPDDQVRVGEDDADPGESATRPASQPIPSAPPPLSTSARVAGWLSSRLGEWESTTVPPRYVRWTR